LQPLKAKEFKESNGRCISEGRNRYDWEQEFIMISEANRSSTRKKKRRKKLKILLEVLKSFLSLHPAETSTSNTVAEF